MPKEECPDCKGSGWDYGIGELPSCDGTKRSPCTNKFHSIPPKDLVNSNVQKPIALFDMDGSLFNYDEALVRDLSKLKSPNEPEILDSNLWGMEQSPYIKERMNLIKSQPGWWLNLNPIKEGFELFNFAKSIGYNCQILTKGPAKHSNAWQEKFQCIRKYFGEDIEIHITQNKSQVYGNVLYDDYAPYMDSWLKHRPRGLGIMPNRKYNSSYTHDNLIKHDNDIKRVKKILDSFLKTRDVHNSIKSNLDNEYQVQCWEYERGFRKRKMDTHYFTNLEQAQNFVNEHNKNSTETIVPDVFFLADDPTKITK